MKCVETEKLDSIAAWFLFVDQTQLDNEIENIRNNLTKKVSDLHQLEGISFYYVLFIK